MKKKKIINGIFSIILCLCFLPVFSIKESDGYTHGPFFSISVLAPTDDPLRNQIATMLVLELEKLGIEVDVFDHTSPEEVSKRTWNHPGPYPVRTYAEGGFDIFFLESSSENIVNLTERLDSANIIPNGTNVYQFDNELMDWAIGNFTAATQESVKIYYANEIQALLYEYLPEITILYQAENNGSELVPTSFSEGIAFNMEHPYLGTGVSCPIADSESGKHLRKAINHIIPRELIINHIYKGQAIPGITVWSPNTTYFDSSLVPYEYSLETAGDHMEAAGFQPWHDCFPPTNISGIAVSALINSVLIFSTILHLINKKRKRGDS